MFSGKPARERMAGAVLLAIATAGLGILLLRPESPLGLNLQRTSYDSYYSWLNLASLPSGRLPVALVYLDLDSYQSRGLDPGQPWPRELHAQLLHRLREAGARAVVFDIVFDSAAPEGTPASAADRALAEAIREHARVVLAAEFAVSSQAAGVGAWPRTTRLALPAEPFRNAAAAWGLGEIGIDDDFVARRHFQGRAHDGEFRPSLVVAAARQLGLAEDGQGDERWTRYYGLPFSLPHTSVRQALDPTAIPDEFFRDTVVLIGARPMASPFRERRDEFRSPFHTWLERDLFMPGVEVHATQLLNLIRNDWLRRPSPSTERSAVIALGLILGAIAIQIRPFPMAVTGVATALGIAGVAGLLFSDANLWFPWIILAGIQVPVAVAGSVLYHSIDWFRTRRRLESAKRVAEARIREQAALLDKANDAIFVTRIDGFPEYANPSAERLYGWTLAELQSGPRAQPALDPQRLQEARSATLQRGEWSGEFLQKTRAGGELVVASRWTLIRDEEGQPKSLLIINSDITDKKQLEAEAARLQRVEAIGTLASGMAHDLNNALAPVLMGAQILQREADDPEARRVLGLMESSARRGAEMVRQVLLFARGRRSESDRLDLRPLAGEIEKLARETFPKNIVIRTHWADDLWPVRGNPTELHQVLLNLCVNARDAMPSGGHLQLALDNVPAAELAARGEADLPPGDCVAILVSDSGLGIPPEIMPRIFEPFFTTKPEGRGTGLGLSTTARIVKAHGGCIRADSRPGEGTTFEILLPRMEFAQQTTEATSMAPPPDGHGETVLIADDDQAVRELLQRALEEHGYRTVTASNGAEAVAQCRALKGLVAVICDRSMPVMDGQQAALEIHQLRAGLPLILMSGEGEAGGDNESVLVKPFALPELLQRLHSVIHETARESSSMPNR